MTNNQNCFFVLTTDVATAVEDAMKLGGESPYLADVNERLSLANVGNYTDSLNAYFATGRQLGFNELHSATAAFATSLAAMQTTRIGVFVTHDLNVACHAAGFGACRVFSDSSWPAFLSGIVAVKLCSRTPRSSSPTPRSSSTTCPYAPGWGSSASGETKSL